MEFQMYDAQPKPPQQPQVDDEEHQQQQQAQQQQPWVAAAAAIDNDDYFNWTNAIKIDDGAHKRKMAHCNDFDGGADAGVISAAVAVKVQRKARTSADVCGASRLPPWQVEDIADLNADIDGSFNGLANGDQSSSSLTMSDAILSLSSMAVLKQEALSPPQTAPLGSADACQEQGANAMLNATLQQLLCSTGYSALPPAIEESAANASSCAEDCRFQYVLAAATSIATKLNEDTLTYLNQGQSYEIKLKKLGDLSTYRGKLLKSIIKICFHERRLQYMETEQISSWRQSRPGDRILEIDVPLSYGLCDVQQPAGALNSIQFSWDPTKEVGAYIKVNCISTEFTPKKHGGEKGVPFRIQVETYQAADGYESPQRLHAAACQIKVFKLKGADRKHKQDREKILKRSISEQEKFQPSYDCTVLNDVPNETLRPISPMNIAFSPDSGAQPAFPHGDGADERQLAKLAMSSPTSSNNNSDKQPDIEMLLGDALTASSNPLQTAQWLAVHHFDKLVAMFTNFAGVDMLRMSRDDLIEICGHVDGIRLYNALHSRSVIPKLTLYVCRNTSSPVYNAIYLSRLTSQEFVLKLAHLLSVPADKINDVYVLGPQMIHVQLTIDVIRNMKDESMFMLEILSDPQLNAGDGKFEVLLKQINKNG